jgi:hypothetical protein
MGSHATINDLVVNRNKRQALEAEMRKLHEEAVTIMAEAADCSVPISEVAWAADCSEGDVRRWTTRH